MGLLDSTQESTDTALAVMASQPLQPEKPAPKHSAWSVVPRAVAAAASELGANAMDTLSGYGQVVAATGGTTPGFDPDAERRRPESIQAANKIKDEGLDFRPSESRPLYDFARDMRPDPITAGSAENIVFSVGKGLTKAIGASYGLGLFGGATVFGGSEGMTEAENLAREGVDLQTRTKVGAVTAGLNTAGMALPVAGKTITQTIGLAIAGGPASFIAQQQATRTILENANYADIAKQYDPLDPVGLTVATLLPAGFGAYAMRGARGVKRTSPDETLALVGESAAVRPETSAPFTQEAIDAAMVHNLTIRGDLNESRIGGVRKQISDGIVDLGNGVSETVIGASRKLREFISGPVKNMADNKTALHFGVVDADVSARILSETGIDVPAGSRHEAATNAIRHAIGRHPDLEPSDWDLLPWVSERFDRSVLLRPEHTDQGPRIALAAVDDSTGYAYVAEYQIGRKKGSRLSLKTFFKDTPENVLNYLKNNGRSKDKSGGSTPDAPMNLAGSESPTSATVSGGYPIEAPKAGSVKNDRISNTLSRVEQLQTMRPDMPVAVREDGSLATVADEIEAIRRQAREGTDTALGSDDAPLLKVAAECLLSRGG